MIARHLRLAVAGGLYNLLTDIDNPSYLNEQIQNLSYTLHRIFRTTRAEFTGNGTIPPPVVHVSQQNPDDSAKT